MAKSILNQYHLSDADRQKILSQSDNPAGKIPPAALVNIERQRVKFAKNNGGFSF